MALVRFIYETDIRWYGEGPHQATLCRSRNDMYWDVHVSGYTGILTFNSEAVVRVPAHRAPDNAPDLDGFYTTTLGKHRKEGN
jgi:hypothetical protein